MGTLESDAREKFDAFVTGVVQLGASYVEAGRALIKLRQSLNPAGFEAFLRQNPGTYCTSLIAPGMMELAEKVEQGQTTVNDVGWLLEKAIEFQIAAAINEYRQRHREK